MYRSRFRAGWFSIPGLNPAEHPQRRLITQEETRGKVEWAEGEISLEDCLVLPYTSGKVLVYIKYTSLSPSSTMSGLKKKKKKKFEEEGSISCFKNLEQSSRGF